VSATGRGAHRIELDWYCTPNPPIEALGSRINWDRVSTACEPCRGSGAIVEALTPFKSLSWECFEIREGWDYLKSNPKPCDLTPTNPPFNQAVEFIQKSLSHSLCVAYLLRLNFLGSDERKDFLNANPVTHLYPLSKRPSFVDVCKGFPNQEPKVKGCGNSFQKIEKVKTCPDCGGKVGAGTDATDYGWLCWDRGGILLDPPGIKIL